jgi:hypothetical protein
MGVSKYGFSSCFARSAIEFAQPDFRRVRARVVDHFTGAVGLRQHFRRRMPVGRLVFGWCRRRLERLSDVAHRQLPKGLRRGRRRPGGYADGKRGARNRAVCPAGHLEAEFTQGYNDGYYVYGVNQNIRGLERELADVRREVDDVRAELDNGYRTDEAGKKYEIGMYERDALYERLLVLGREEGRLEGEIATLRNSIAGS